MKIEEKKAEEQQERMPDTGGIKNSRHSSSGNTITNTTRYVNGNENKNNYDWEVIE